MTKWERFKRWVGIGYTPKTKVAAQYDEEVVQRYIDAGAIFGDAVSYIYMGECVGFEDRLKDWEEAEQAYAALGYRTISLDDFVSFGGYGKELQGLTVARDEGEAPIYHAVYYRVHFLGRCSPVINFDEMMKTGEAQVGTYAVPSTKHLTEE